MKKKQVIEMTDREHGLRGIGDIKYTYTYQEKRHKLIIELLLLKKTIEYEGDEAKKYYYHFLREGDKEKIDLVKRLAADAVGIPVIRLKENSRKKDVVWARNMVMWFVYNFMQYSREDTASLFDKDHATAFHGATEFAKDYKYLKDYQSISKKRFINKCNEHRLFNRV